MQPLSNLLKLEPKSKANSERAELIKFFVENLRDKKNKPFPAKRIAIAVSHLKLNDLYYMKSVFSDISKCKGLDSASKWWWWSIRK